MWQPITLSELYDEIHNSEKELIGELSNFWDLIKIEPAKWQEENYGNEGGGFWVVAICGQRIVWYNDIEEGFNISNYTNVGKIDDYWCNQDTLIDSLQSLYSLIKFGGDVIGRGAPRPL